MRGHEAREHEVDDLSRRVRSSCMVEVGTLHWYGMLSSGQEGSFARFTMSVRIPAVAQAVLDSFGHSDALEFLRDAVRNDEPIEAPEGDDPEFESWKENFEIHLKGKTWLNAPWLFSEAFFYRKLLEATGFYSSGKDPFRPQKRKELDSQHVWDLAVKASEASMAGDVVELLHYCLWGNRSDLCYKKLSDDEKSRDFKIKEEQRNVLVNDAEAFLAFCSSRRIKSLGIITDNGGAELIMDLILAEYLLSSRSVQSICLHVKASPTFVSDATVDDVTETISELKSRLPTTGHRLESFWTSQLEAVPDPFWNGWKFFKDIPLELKDRLRRHDIVVCKGDANYRRLVEDTRHSATDSFDLHAQSFPVKLLCIRTLKSVS